MIRQFFLEGGYGMWILLMLALGVVAVAALFANGNDRMRAPAWVLVAAAVFAGAAVMLQARSLVDAAVANVDPQMRDAIVEQGNKEAARPLQLGVGIAVLGAIVAGTGELRLRRKQ